MRNEKQDYIWLLTAKKLSGEATSAELDELERLLRENPDLHYSLEIIMDLWAASDHSGKKEAEAAFKRHLDRHPDLSDGQPAQPVVDPSLTLSSFSSLTYADDPHHPEKIPERMEGTGSTHRLHKFRKPLMAAALFIGLVLIAFFSGYFDSHPARPFAATAGKNENRNEITTRNGSRSKLVLPDGTQVWLNSGSKLVYDKNFGNTHREVSLSGEAFFDVARNPEKPFVIHAASIDIKVLGTRFNVKSYPADKTTETTLIRGSIEVAIKDRPDEKIILKPNEKLVVANDDSILHRARVNPAVASSARNGDEPLVSIKKPTYQARSGEIIETSWVENKLVFQDESFHELALRMERWYGVDLRFTDPGQEELRFTGSFTNETIRQAMDALKLTESSAFNYTIQGNIVTIYNK